MMNYLRTTILFIGLFATTQLMAQVESCYEGFIQQAKSHLDSFQFDSARLNFIAAFHCPDANLNDTHSLEEYLLNIEDKIDWYMTNRKINLFWEEGRILFERRLLEAANKKFTEALKLSENDNDYSIKVNTILNQIDIVDEEIRQDSIYKQKLIQFDDYMALGHNIRTRGPSHYDQAFHYYNLAAELFAPLAPEREPALFAQYNLLETLELCLAKPCFDQDNYTRTFLKLAELEVIESADSSSNLAMDKVSIALSNVDVFRATQNEFETIEVLIKDYYRKFYGPWELTLFTEYSPPSITLLTGQLVMDTLNNNVYQTSKEQTFDLVPNLGWGLQLDYRVITLPSLSITIGAGLEVYSTEVKENNKLKSSISESFFDYYSSMRFPILFKVEGTASPRWRPALSMVLIPTIFQINYQGSTDESILSKRILSRSTQTLYSINASVKYKIYKRHHLFAEIAYMQKRQDTNTTPDFIGVDFKDLELDGYIIHDKWISFRLGYSYRFNR